MGMRLLAILLAAVLFASALALVASRYRSRTLFAELELARQDAKSLEADGARLRSELGRLSQPAAVESSARAIGLRPIPPERTVLLEAPAAPPAVAAAGP